MSNFYMWLFVSSNKIVKMIHHWGCLSQKRPKLLILQPIYQQKPKKLRKLIGITKLLFCSFILLLCHFLVAVAVMVC